MIIVVANELGSSSSNHKQVCLCFSSLWWSWKRHEISVHPVDWQCRIRQLHPCEGVRLPPTTNVLSIKLNCIQWWGSTPRTLVKCGVHLIAITSYSTLTWMVNTCLGPVYRSNKTVQSFNKDHYYQSFEIIQLCANYSYSVGIPGK